MSLFNFVNLLLRHFREVNKDILKRLFRSIDGKPDDDIVKVAYDIVKDEENKGHHLLSKQLKAILDQKGVSYEERNVEGPDWTPEQFFEEVPPGTRTFPQIYIDGKYIGTYDNMMSFWTVGELSL